jgi:hypothetical protein
MTNLEAHDPTASATTYPDRPAADTHLSRNEIETLCLKAARGAGLPWGLAEEAGFAAGWLASQGIDGAAALLNHLEGITPSSLAPISVLGRHWQGLSDGALCPITLGAALDDHAMLDAGPHAGPITTNMVSQPVLLVPFLARMVKATGKPLTLAWQNGSASVTPDGHIDTYSLSLRTHAALTISSFAGVAQPGASVPAIAPILAQVLAGLNALSMRTTVPASDASRRGAGATASDND